MTRRPRRRGRATVDLVGFLDLLSAVMVIVLLVISVLALSIGVASERPAPGPRPVVRPAPPPPPAAPKDPAPLVEITTADGTPITTATTFLLCRGGVVERHDPVQGTVTDRWDLLLTSPFEIAAGIRTENTYLAVAGSCFAQIDPLVDALRSSGSQVGYEPIEEGARAPWQTSTDAP